ncbi:MAG: metallopeptidase TldD-related protein [Acidimicrobiales bacterium]
MIGASADAATGGVAARTETYIDELVTGATAGLHGDEVLMVSAQGEYSDFVRFNRSLVRQAGSVEQLYAEVDLSSGARHAAMTLGLSFDPDLDRAALAAALDRLRDQRRALPDDPYFAYATDAVSTSHTNPGRLPAPDELVDTVTAAAAGHDLVGIWAAGTQFSAFANSLGQRNWFASTTFNLDWSLFLPNNQAIKRSYAGFTWSPEAFRSKLDDQVRLLDVLSRPLVEAPPGEYRAFLTPKALSMVFAVLSWGGFGLRSHRSMSSPLAKLVTESRRLSPAVTLTEDTAGGVAPDFQDQGYRRPASVPLVVDGVHAGYLVSPRSAAEYGVDGNGASGHEAPESIAMAPGSLEPADALTALGTGLYVANLWYLNYSDRANARITGMTRFASFWVEDGEIVGPVSPLRFDDTVYGLFGDRLEALTSEAELVLDYYTYGGRSTTSDRLPGLLVSDMRFTL